MKGGSARSIDRELSRLRAAENRKPKGYSSTRFDKKKSGEQQRTVSSSYQKSEAPEEGVSTAF